MRIELNGSNQTSVHIQLSICDGIKVILLITGAAKRILFQEAGILSIFYSLPKNLLKARQLKCYFSNGSSTLKCLMFVRHLISIIFS